MRKRISARLPGARARQPPSHARCAAATAAFTSPGVAAATSVKTSSVAGLVSFMRGSGFVSADYEGGNP